MNKKRLGLISLVVISLPFIALWQRYAIFDYIRLRGYTPPAEVKQLADDTTMVDSSRRLYYVYHPQIEDKSTFNKECRDNEQTIVLGCYVEGQGIHIFNVTDERLAGIEQVAAAHEMLHAAYSRLSSSERKKVDSMTNLAFGGLTDQNLKDRIELYRKQDPSIVPNELHSILGTVARNLPAELETYYKRYFSDRSKVVTYAEAYSKAFEERKNQISAYDTQLTELKSQIDELKNTLNQESASLSSRRARLDNLRSSGQIAAYNAAIPEYNQQVNAYNGHINELSDLIDQYNSIVVTRNALAVEESELVKAIDSREVPSRQ